MDDATRRYRGAGFTDEIQLQALNSTSTNIVSRRDKDRESGHTDGDDLRILDDSASGEVSFFLGYRKLP